VKIASLDFVGGAPECMRKGFRKPRGGPPYVNVPAPSRPHHHAIEQAE
jgi:hypothetical protein